MINIPGARHGLTNRHGVKMNVWVDGPVDAGAPVAFIMHGFSGNVKQPVVQAMTRAFRDNGYITVCIDATNSLNSSGGALEKAHWTNHENDLADAIAWARTQAWFREPFALAGHSMGGAAVMSYAAANADAVKMLVPAAAPVSGALYFKALEQNNPQHLKDWRDRGYYTITFNNQAHKRLWDHTHDDYMRHDMVRDAAGLTMPVLLVAGGVDGLTPPWTMKALHDAIPGARKEFHIINGAPHGFEKNETALCALMTTWIGRQDEKTLRQNRRPFNLG